MDAVSKFPDDVPIGVTISGLSLTFQVIDISMGTLSAPRLTIRADASILAGKPISEETKEELEHGSEFETVEVIDARTGISKFIERKKTGRRPK